MSEDFLDTVKWNNDGLVPAIAQDAATGRVLMMAWMNRESLALTARDGRAVYWSRSRGQLWRKGETSGHYQEVHAIQLECEGDTLLLQVLQHGGIACHTGRERCFFQTLGEDGHWQTTEPVIKEPAEIYGK
jgi:phosphoribosyl-AMP cyclohydrolase